MGFEKFTKRKPKTKRVKSDKELREEARNMKRSWDKDLSSVLDN